MSLGWLDAFYLRDGALVLHVAGVERALRLKQQQMRLFRRKWTMLDAARDDEEFAFFQPDVAVVQLHQQASLHHKEQFVFAIMVVPDEFAFDLFQLDMRVIQVAGNSGMPIVVEEAELLRQIDLLHKQLTSFLYSV